MADGFEIAERNSEILKAMTNVEFYPVAAEEQTSIATYSKLSLSRVSALGTAFEPVADAFRHVVSGGEGKSGLYRVTMPEGTHLAQFKQRPGFLGTVLSDDKNQMVGQATLNPLACNPTMVFMAVALASIDKKLDVIQEIQQEMLDFLVQKERSELKGDLNFLVGTMNNYKYNWSNEKYKNSNHIKVLDIKQSSERKIDFYREQISSKIKRKSYFHSDQDVNKQLGKIQSDFKDYQLALYLYSFASFLEILLLENYNSTYLEGIAKRIEDYSFQYRECYTTCYERIEKYAKSSIQSHLLSGLVNANRVTGKAIGRVPVVSKAQIDETFAQAGDRLGKFGSKRIEHTMKQLIENQSSCVHPFVENINLVNRLYNQPIEILFDEENMYIAAV